MDRPPQALTRSQMAVVRLLVAGLNPTQAAKRRSRSVSATYEIMARICDRWNLDEWTEIAPEAIRNETVDPPAS